MANVTSIPYSLSIGNADPIDRRLVLTKAEMLAMKTMKMPRNDITKYFALCVDDNQFYVYDKDATLDSETGKFRLVSSYTPTATDDTAGPVKSSSSVDFITVNDDGTMSVNQVSAGKLTNSEGITFVINGGSAPSPEES